MNSGYVKLHRKLLDNGIIKNPNLVQFWVYCLLRASHTERHVVIGLQEVQLNPGEFIFGRKAAAEALGQTEKVIRGLVGHSQKRGLIKATMRASKFTVYSIVNWSSYQAVEEDQGQQADQQQGQQRASKGPHTRMSKNVKSNFSLPLKGEDAGYVLPDWVPLDLFKDFKEMRQKKKKPLTARAIQLAIADLSVLRDSGEDIRRVMENAILHSYDTFYTLQDTRNRPGTQHREHGGLVL